MLLYRMDDRFKRLRVIQGEVSQYFAVELDIVFTQLVDQPGVRQAILTGAGVDPGDPQATVCLFLGFAIPVGIAHTLVEGVFRSGKDVAAGSKETFGCL